MCLLVAVIDGSFGHVDRFPKCKVKKTRGADTFDVNRSLRHFFTRFLTGKEMKRGESDL